jgi:hypothetical protein
MNLVPPPLRWRKKMSLERQSMHATFSCDDSTACQPLVAMDAVILDAKRLDEPAQAQRLQKFAAFAL